MLRRLCITRGRFYVTCKLLKIEAGSSAIQVINVKKVVVTVVENDTMGV